MSISSFQTEFTPNIGILIANNYQTNIKTLTGLEIYCNRSGYLILSVKISLYFQLEI